MNVDDVDAGMCISKTRLLLDQIHILTQRVPRPLRPRHARAFLRVHRVTRVGGVVFRVRATTFARVVYWGTNARCAPVYLRHLYIQNVQGNSQENERKSQKVQLIFSCSTHACVGRARSPTDIQRGAQGPAPDNIRTMPYFHPPTCTNAPRD
jgi:hypothetical protein